MTGAFVWAFNHEKHTDERNSDEDLGKAYKSLRTRVHLDAAADPDSLIYLSVTDQETLLRFELMQTRATYRAITTYFDDFIGADTFIYEERLASRNFLVEGFGVVSGGDLNYVSVGMMAAHWGHPLPLVSAQATIWNMGQLIGAQGVHNYAQMYSGSFWAGYGYAYYRENKQ